MKNPCHKPKMHVKRATAFTLLELLTVLGTLAVLALMLLPALADTKGDGRLLRCMNNQKQLTAAWLLYTADNSDRLMPSPGWAGGVMDWNSTTDNTNSAILESSSQSVIAQYIKAATLFKCPEDVYQSSANPGPRVRSISLNGVLTSSGAGPIVQGTNPGGRLYYGSPNGAARTMAHLIKPGPSQVFVFIDEHPDSINDSVFMLDPGYAAASTRFRDLPASYHSGGGGSSFADGHYELHRWQLTSTTRSVQYVPWNPLSVPVVPNNQDYLWLASKMPYR